jgi:effector-binding domain-containing protein/DNA-binding transcriptional MerR regulator
MLKIGDFSRLSQVSIKALRLYDQLDLLKPTQVDDFTGYRYYAASQLPRLHRILVLKELGFSLEQIGQLLNDSVSAEQIRGMLRLKRSNLQAQIEEEAVRLRRIETYLQQIEQENEMTIANVVIKKIGPALVASIREVIPKYTAIAPLYGEIYPYLYQQGAKPSYSAAIWHDRGYQESDVDSEAMVFIDKEIPSSDRITVYELPGHEQMACYVHHGSYQTLTLSYNILLKWIEDNAYQLTGPSRELYIQGGPEIDNESYITELQFPVNKR